VTTAVVSDLHLGSRASLLADADARRRLFLATDCADRIVLLGDVLALRAAPARLVLAEAASFFDELRERFSGRELVIVPGNHDHQLAEPLLDEVRIDGALGLETVRPAPEVGVLGSIVHRLSGVRTSVAYPGFWIRPDVYATHGHYLDCHQSVPRLETVLASMSSALAGGLSDAGLTPLDYESRLAPIYGFAYRWAQGGNGSPRSTAATRLWRRIRSEGWRELEAGTAREKSAAGASAGRSRKPLVRLAVAAMNQAGLGPFDARLGAAQLGEAGRAAMHEVARRLGIDAAHLVYGHTHCAGPFGAGEPRTAPGPLLVNTGSWTYSSTLVGGAGEASPYWPGTCVFVDDEGPPRLERLLDADLVERLS
jgi:predicted phosphodiesterase